MIQRYRYKLIGHGLRIIFPPNNTYDLRRNVPWWKFWVKGKWMVFQNWDFYQPFTGFTKRRALAFIAARKVN